MGNAKSKASKAKHAAASAAAGGAACAAGESRSPALSTEIAVHQTVSIDDFELLKVVGKGRCVGVGRARARAAAVRASASQSRTPPLLPNPFPAPPRTAPPSAVPPALRAAASARCFSQ